MWRIAISAFRTWIYLKTIVDVRRMYGTLKLHPQPLLGSHIFEQIARLDHSAKAKLCRAIEHVDADHLKRVRFEINIDNNKDTHQNNDNESVWNNDVGFGMCRSSSESSDVEL